SFPPILCVVQRALVLLDALVPLVDLDDAGVDLGHPRLDLGLRLTDGPPQHEPAQDHQDGADDDQRDEQEAGHEHHVVAKPVHWVASMPAGQRPPWTVSSDTRHRRSRGASVTASSMAGEPAHQNDAAARARAPQLPLSGDTPTKNRDTPERFARARRRYEDAREVAVAAGLEPGILEIIDRRLADLPGEAAG